MPPLLSPNPPPVLPQLHGFSIIKRPTFASIIATRVDGSEFQGIMQAFPLWDFELRYERLASETQNQTAYAQYADSLQYEEMAEVYLACAGQYGRFLFEDATDNSRAAQVLGEGDGTETEFRLVRTWGAGALAVTEPVGAFNSSQTATVYFDGSPQSADSWSISADLTTLVLDSAPGVGVEVTMDFYFYYRCRFLEDKIDLDQFLYNLWQIGSLKFRSTKD